LRDLRSFPTRRSSDLVVVVGLGASLLVVRSVPRGADAPAGGEAVAPAAAVAEVPGPDRPESLSLGWRFGYDADGEMNEVVNPARSEEHTSELQSPDHL